MPPGLTKSRKLLANARIVEASGHCKASRYLEINSTDLPIASGASC